MVGLIVLTLRAPSSYALPRLIRSKNRETLYGSDHHSLVCSEDCNSNCPQWTSTTR